MCGPCLRFRHRWWCRRRGGRHRLFFRGIQASLQFAGEIECGRRAAAARGAWRDDLGADYVENLRAGSARSWMPCNGLMGLFGLPL